MPAELVYAPDVNVRVAWGTAENGEVQVVTQAVKMGEAGSDPYERIIGVVNQWLKDAGQPVIDAAKVKAALPYKPMFDGWWASLTEWTQVNRLIHILRKARDRQFGPPA